jgi:molybdate transport system substrate-binding protein
MHRTLRIRRGLAVAAVLALALPLAACSSDDDTATPQGSATPSSSSQELVVFAASSLTNVFNTLKPRFEAAHPGAKVTLNFGSSGDLATQINQGAPADVFASADMDNMQKVVDAGNVVGTPVTFVRNRLEIVVPSANPGGVTGLSDFSKDSLKIALCVETAPCGKVADNVLKAAGVDAKPDTREVNVRAVLTKVDTGEADAGLVYHTDVLSDQAKVKGIPFTKPESEAVTPYPIAPLKGAKQPELAQDWVDYVQTDEAQTIFKAAEFLAPTGPDTLPSAEPTDDSTASPSDEPSTDATASATASATSSP